MVVACSVRRVARGGVRGDDTRVVRAREHTLVLWQELPKSMSLIADRLGLHSRMFSGLRSQWMIPFSGFARKANALSNWRANLRTRLSDTPLKDVLRSSSYKLENGGWGRGEEAVSDERLGVTVRQRATVESSLIAQVLEYEARV